MPNAYAQPHPPPALRRILLLVTPLAVTPLLGWLIGEGWLNFGGGEKDLLLLIPWLLWSVLLCAIGLMGWRRWPALWPWAGRTIAWSFGLLLLCWLALVALFSYR